MAKLRRTVGPFLHKYLHPKDQLQPGAAATVRRIVRGLLLPLDVIEQLAKAARACVGAGA